MIELSAKKKFLSWLIQYAHLKKRESYWIINYLINHEALLSRVIFVEGALETPRGILITDQTIPGIGLEMKTEQKRLTDAQSIFADIRNNRKEDLYLEINFSEKEASPLYQLILEENAYQVINTEEQIDFLQDFEAFLLKEEKELKLRHLQEEIDQALLTQNEEDFLRLSQEYLALKKESTFS